MQTSNYQANMRPAGGANIIVVTKSGSSRFSGSAAYFKRHEALTENTWDRRRTCDATGARHRCARSRATATTTRRSRWADQCSSRARSSTRTADKLFFFYSLDLLPRTRIRSW